METTIGQLLVNDALPEDLRDYTRVLDKKAVAALLAEVADKYPDKYANVSDALHRLGAEVSTSRGREASLSLDSLRTPDSVRKLHAELIGKVQKVLAGPGDSRAKNAQVVQTVGGYIDPITDLNYEEGLKDKNPLALQVSSGSRGNKHQFRSLRGGDLMYSDHKDNPIPIPILASFAEGLDPVQYWAGAYGARKGSVSVKFSTPKAGFLGKQLSLAAHRMMVTEKDCGTANGLPVAAADADNEGAVLLSATGRFGAGTVLTPKVIKQLGDAKILVRSPLTCRAEKGICQQCAGKRERGGFPPLGDNLGVAAAQAVCLSAETLVQMADGYSKPIKDIKVGDTVLGCSIAGILQPVKVLAVFCNGEKNCVKAVFRRGVGQASRENLLEVTATREHKLLSEIVVRSCEAAARRLSYFEPVAIRPLGTEIRNKFDRFCAKLADSFEDSGFRTEPMALLLGLLIGDGSYTGCGDGCSVYFCCFDPELVDDMRDWMEQHQLAFSDCSGGNYLVKDLTATFMKYTIEGTAYRNRVRQLLVEEGMWGAGAKEKKLPRSIHAWDNSSVAALISGFLATDGCVTKDGFLQFSSSSCRLLSDLRQLIGVRFGVWGTSICASVKLRKEGGTYDPNYKFNISRKDDVTRLGQWLWVPGVKRARLRSATEQPISGTVRVRGRCSLVSMEDVGFKQTYDLYVDHPDHLFMLANGLIVSNSEPLGQGALSEKHVGGQMQQGRGRKAGFDLVNQLVQVPEHFQGAAAMAETDGRVDSVESAPQGGQYVHVGGVSHWVSPSETLTVRKGDMVEAGDVLSSGIPNPSQVVHHKGIGEGRRYFMEQLRKVMTENKFPAHRRNLELLSRGLINHVRVTDLDGPADTVPDDVVEYDDIVRGYTPRFGFKTVAPRQAVGLYLEEPVLHYSIGTRVTPKVSQLLGEHGVDSFKVHADPPPFVPEMTRAMETISHSGDWMVRLGGFHLKKGLTEAVHRGRESSAHGTSFMPALAQGTEFGTRDTEY